MVRSTKRGTIFIVRQRRKERIKKKILSKEVTIFSEDGDLSGERGDHPLPPRIGLAKAN